MGALQKTMVKVSATVFLFVACLSVLITFSAFKEEYSTAPRSKHQMLPGFERLEQKQRERQDRLQKYCSTSSIKQKLNREALKYLIVNDNYKTVYCYIPKVACTQWKRVFLALSNINLRNVTDGKVIHNRTYYRFLDSYSDEEIKLRLQTYYKFFFVRYPMERLLSCFRDKFELENDDKYYEQTFSKRIVESFRRSIDPKSDNSVTFEKFVHYISTVGFNEDDHWATYDFICQPCVILYDFIGRFEDMSEEVPYILRQTGMDKAATFPSFHTHNTKSKILEYYATIPKVKIVQLVKLYERDYEMFNYRFPGPLAQYLEGFLN
ncbi:carbohydrate sulfotransferase 11-like [Acropora millepora]|uniref:carbohydrate sulfotransferase 11-like n=1 Tax=Acropora millepora TaxID=45264 RepID=UPI001CF28D2E|nr:carbohydrate sulfotransferase 11-like [Acropora millepora]